MGRVRGCGLLYGAAMERERWRGWETAAFVLRSLERLGRNESGSSVQDSLMLCATNDTVYLFVPEDRSTPPTAFYDRKMPLSFSFWMCDALEWKGTRDSRLACVQSISHQEKKGWSIAWKTWFSKFRFAFSFLFFFSQIIIIQLRDTLLLYIRRLLFRVIKRH